MAMAARKIEAEFQMQESTVLEKKVDRIQEDVAALKADVKVLRSDVDHLQKDVTDIKTDMKRIDAKVDAVGASLTEHRVETEKSFAKVHGEIGALKNDLTAAIGTLRVEMRDFRSAQTRWIIGTLLLAAGVALTAAKYFSTGM